MPECRSGLTEIKVTFLDPAGKTAGKLVLPIARKSRRMLDHQLWDRGEAIKKFNWYLARGDQAGLEAAYEVLDRLRCIGAALESCMRGRKPDRRKTQTLLSLWNTRGLWSLPRALGDDLATFTDAVRYFAPPYSGDALTLYRGQSRERYERGVFGIAWTGRLVIAEQFARNRSTSGVVLRLRASSDLIIAKVANFISTPKTNPARKLEFEDEYLVDPRDLTGRVKVVSTFQP